MVQVIKSGGGAGSVLNVTQAAHGFVVGNAVYVNSAGVWAKARANAEATLAHGVVVAVLSSGSFSVVASGLQTWTAHGFTLGAMRYLDTGTAGLTTATKPTQSGLFVQALFTPLSVSAVTFHDMPVLRL